MHKHYRAKCCDVLNIDQYELFILVWVHPKDNTGHKAAKSVDDLDAQAMAMVNFVAHSLFCDIF